MMKNTIAYEGAHGKKPRGWGRWGFEITGTDGNGAWLTETVWVTEKLVNARAQAVSDFTSSCGRVKKVTEVKVLP